jgi:sulfite exporter TauE/SafE
MILMGLSILGKSSFMARLESFSFFDRYLRSAFKKVLLSRSLGSFYFLGLLNGLLPCGFVYFFAVTAASTASAVDGAIVMALFGIATIPILFTMGFFVGILQKPGLRKMMNRVAGWIITAYGFYMLYKGYLFLFTEAPSCH